MTTHPAADVRFVVGIFLILLKFFVVFLKQSKSLSKPNVSI